MSAWEVVHVTAAERRALETDPLAAAKLHGLRARLFNLVDAERHDELSRQHLVLPTPRARFTPEQALVWVREMEAIEDSISTAKQ